MKSKATITYIIGNKEETIIPHFYNRKKVFSTDDMFTKDLRYSVYNINPDIQLIHFKNFTFLDCKRIECSENTLCILEDCTFWRKESPVQNLFFKGGTFELIRPNFVGFEEVDASLYWYTQEFHVVYPMDEQGECCKRIGLNLKNEFGKKVAIMDQKHLRDIKIATKEIHIDGVVDTDDFCLKGDNIFVGNEKESTMVTFGSYISEIDASEKLSLKNCILEGKDDFWVTLTASKMEIENSTLKAKRGILINEDMYYQKNEENKVVVTDKDLVRTNFIQILKGYKKVLEQQVLLQTEEHLQADRQEYQRQIEMLTSELRQKEEMVMKSIENQPIKQLQLKMKK